MTGYGDQISEGSSTNCPLAFNGENYTFWKMKMKIFIKANGYKLWQIIEDGNFIPEDENGILKRPVNYTEEDIAGIELNSKAILMIQSVLNRTEYFRISHLKNVSFSSSELNIILSLNISYQLTYQFMFSQFILVIIEM